MEKGFFLEFLTHFVKKSYLSLSTECTFKFVVNDRNMSEFYPRHISL
jgi:hypothetical protein